MTGRSTSACLPLGTSSTISVCRGASMAQGPDPKSSSSHTNNKFAELQTPPQLFPGP